MERPSAGLSGFPRRWPLQVPSERLFALDGFEQSFEIAFAEAAAAFALDDFVEQGGAVFDGTSEDLQHVTLVVAVDEDAETLELVDGLVDASDAVGELGVVGVGDAEELYALAFQPGDCIEDVVGGECDVLH